MNSPEPKNQAPQDPEEDRSSGPNLMLIYSLVGLALLAAIVIALLIVFPFYRRI